MISLVGVEPPVMLDQDDASQSAYSDAWNDGSDGGGNGFGAWKLTLQTPEEVSGTLLRVVDGSVVIQSGNNEVTFTLKLGQTVILIPNWLKRSVNWKSVHRSSLLLLKVLFGHI